jgi:preprotein translocase subunit SecA
MEREFLRNNKLDIELGEGVVELGGLAVFGVERNEARRIDNQLRGRAGRQGYPGFSRFYVAMDDELMLRFGGEILRKIFGRLGNDFIQSRMLTRAISNAQKKAEGMNFDQRKNILDYDNVLAEHREAMYARRDLGRLEVSLFHGTQMLFTMFTRGHHCPKYSHYTPLTVF